MEEKDFSRKVTDTKLNIKASFSEYSNVIGFVIVIAVYIGISVLGRIINPANMNFINWNVLQWIIFCIFPLVTATVGTIAKSFLKKQGVRHGMQDPTVLAVHEELTLLQSDGPKIKIPDSYEKFFVKGSVKGTITSFVFSVGLSLLITMLGIDFSIENLLSMFISLAMWICFGINDYVIMVDYIKNKHIIWMRHEIKIIKEEIIKEKIIINQEVKE